MEYPAGPLTGERSLPKNLNTQVAIIDYGMGNLFSIKQACEYVGLTPVITSDKQDIEGSRALILPGVGAFGDAMDTLHRLDLVSVILDVANSNKPLLGICLGMQLLMSESPEFGLHSGLGIIEGEVAPLQTSAAEGPRALKVPQVGWNRIHAPSWNQEQKGYGETVELGENLEPHWNSTLFHGLTDGDYMYFVHSFFVQPSDADVVVSTTQYGTNRFCSSLRRQNVFGCQFHPERSGLKGLHIYRNLARLLAPEAV